MGYLGRIRDRRSLRAQSPVVLQGCALRCRQGARVHYRGPLPLEVRDELVRGLLPSGGVGLPRARLLDGVLHGIDLVRRGQLVPQHLQQLVVARQGDNRRQPPRQVFIGDVLLPPSRLPLRCCRAARVLAVCLGLPCGLRLGSRDHAFVQQLPGTVVPLRALLLPFLRAAQRLQQVERQELVQLQWHLRGEPFLQELSVHR